MALVIKTKQNNKPHWWKVLQSVQNFELYSPNRFKIWESYKILFDLKCYAIEISETS